jgi:hypothetical protein
MDGFQRAANATLSSALHPLLPGRYLPRSRHLRRLKIFRDALGYADPALRELLWYPLPTATACLVPVACELERLVPTLATTCLVAANAEWAPLQQPSGAGQPIDWRPTLCTQQPCIAATVLAALLNGAACALVNSLSAPAATALHAMLTAVNAWAAAFEGTDAATTQRHSLAVLVALRRAMTELEADFIPLWEAAAFHTVPPPQQLQPQGYNPGSC